MVETLHCDLCVIGAGSGGLTLAAGASQMGASVVLVERGQMGGECLYSGCVPSKALLSAAAGQTSFAAAYDHVRRTIQQIAPHDSRERFEGFGVRVIAESARFTGRRSLAAGNFEIRARRYVLATGSTPHIPPLPGIDEVPLLTNETLFTACPEPRHLLVLGGGPMGVEMAQAFRRLGAEVSLIEAGEMMPRDDGELTAVIRARLVAEGVALYEHHQATRVAPDGTDIRLTCTGAEGAVEISGSHLLVAAGRRANVGGLDLEKAGIDYSPMGIAVDARLRTTNKKVFAIGDVAGGYQFTHVAGYQAGIVIRNALFRLPAKSNMRAVPWVTYTSPELAQVGLTEAEARKTHSDIKVLTWPFAENDRAQAERTTAGLIKVVTTGKGLILGAGIVGPHGGELIQTWVLAMSKKMKIGDIASMIAPYPTLGEVSKRAAGSFYTPSLFGEKTKRLVRFLRLFG